MVDRGFAAFGRSSRAGICKCPLFTCSAACSRPWTNRPKEAQHCRPRSECTEPGVEEIKHRLTPTVDGQTTETLSLPIPCANLPVKITPALPRGARRRRVDDLDEGTLAAASRAYAF